MSAQTNISLIVDISDVDVATSYIISFVDVFSFVVPAYVTIDRRFVKIFSFAAFENTAIEIETELLK